jgi:hypothetical protein
LAVTAPCTALICVASAPPWILVPQLGALPFLARQMPAILAGRPIRPDEGTLRRLALHDLPEPEQYELVPTFGAESGQAFRTTWFRSNTRSAISRPGVVSERL